jgi:hypothetical protein
MKKRSAMTIAAAITLSLVAGMVSREVTLASSVKSAAPVIVRVAPAPAAAAPAAPTGEINDG